mmetsp:Transcript_31179/g.56576  ORF Transcript_31179/g.56576 Transcript_31179/m.56576 type:complete len:614 (+) Transcript_31179:154-1995(+)
MMPPPSCDSFPPEAAQAVLPSIVASHSQPTWTIAKHPDVGPPVEARIVASAVPGAAISASSIKKTSRSEPQAQSHQRSLPPVARRYQKPQNGLLQTLTPNRAPLSPISRCNKQQRHVAPSSHHSNAVSKLSVAVPMLPNSFLDTQRAGDAAVSSVSGAASESKGNVLRGVTVRPSGKWQVQLYYAGHSRYIGVFDTKPEAAAAYERARECCSNFDKLDPTQKMIKRNIELSCKAAFDGGTCRRKQMTTDESKQMMTNESKKSLLASSESEKQGTKKSKPATTAAMAVEIPSSATTITAPPPAPMTGTSSDEENSDLNKKAPKKGASKIGRRCPCICMNVDCSAIIKARKAMGLEDGRIELPSMDLLKKPNLRSKEKLDVSILTTIMDALPLDVADIKTKKNRIQCDHYALDVRHRLRRSRGVIYVACKFFTSEGVLVAPTQSIEDRVAELNILQIIHQKAPASFARIKDGLVGKGDLVVTKELLATVYAGVAHPAGKAIGTQQTSVLANVWNSEYRCPRYLRVCDQEVARVSPDGSMVEKGLKRSLEGNVGGVAATTDAKTGGMRNSAVTEVEAARRKRNKMDGSCNVGTMACGVESGLSFLVQACETREGNF